MNDWTDKLMPFALIALTAAMLGLVAFLLVYVPASINAEIALQKAKAAAIEQCLKERSAYECLRGLKIEGKIE